MDDKSILDLFAEVGKLKLIKRSGWWMLGIPREESVAEHSFRCAAIGYVLARMEGADPFKVLIMTLFGDLHEARMNDQHKVAHRYLNVREGEKAAFTDQISRLEGDIKNDLAASKEEYDRQETPESLIARDADILECLIQAKEYVDQGFKSAEKFFKQAPDHLMTESAKRLWEGTSDWDSNDWWERLGKFER